VVQVHAYAVSKHIHFAKLDLSVDIITVRRLGQPADSLVDVPIYA
jgi:hypothetical protein